MEPSSDLIIWKVLNISLLVREDCIVARHQALLDQIFTLFIAFYNLFYVHFVDHYRFDVCLDFVFRTLSDAEHVMYEQLLFHVLPSSRN
jgi:hypothetical protein